jgi:hypothetical protein
MKNTRKIMRVDTRFAAITLTLILGLIYGCSSGGDGGNGGTPPVNNPPEVEIISGPPDSIFFNETADFTWSGSDPDGNLSGFYAGLDGNYAFTTATSASYSGFDLGSIYIFRVYAQDDEGVRSDTVAQSFAVRDYQPTLEFLAYGEGVVDDDGDGFWTQFTVRWSPQVLAGGAVELRLIVGLQPTYGSDPEILDSTNLVQRAPGDEDTLSYNLPPLTKNYYNIRAELHDAAGASLIAIPYDSITSLTSVGLEDLDGFHAWFDDAWTANAVDTLDPAGYYEFIDIWWDVDAYPDAGPVKVVVYERDEAGVESNFFESQVYNVEGFGGDDAFGLRIEAGTTVGLYDYRLKLLDQQNNLLDEINYGEDPDLMDIPLGVAGGFRQNRVSGTALK